MSKNETAEEQMNRIDRDLKELSFYAKMLINQNKELKARNNELEKENKKLHDAILHLSQSK